MVDARERLSEGGKWQVGSMRFWDDGGTAGDVPDSVLEYGVGQFSARKEMINSLLLMFLLLLLCLHEIPPSLCLLSPQGPLSYVGCQV